MRKNTNTICSFSGCNKKVAVCKVKGKIYYRKKCDKHRRPDLYHERKRFWKRYGIEITPKGYEKLLKQQNEVCAICGKVNKSGKALAVDHCHLDGKIRGLLCTWCNTHLEAIGLWKWFEKAKKYLAKY